MGGGGVNPRDCYHPQERKESEGIGRIGRSFSRFPVFPRRGIQAKRCGLRSYMRDFDLSSAAFIRRYCSCPNRIFPLLSRI